MLSKFSKLVKRMTNNSEDKRVTAMKEFERIEMTEINYNHINYLIKSSIKVHQDNQNSSLDCSSALMEFVSRYEITNLIPSLIDNFPYMSIWSRSITLSILTRLQTDESLHALLQILDENIDAIDINDFQIFITGKEQNCADILFPELFKYIEYPNISYSINRLIWSCLHHGTLNKEVVQIEESSFLNAYELLKKSLISHQKKLTNEVIWSPQYQAIRNSAGLLIDIFGYLDSVETLKELVDSLEFKTID